MGLAVHPDYDQNTFIYAMYAYNDSGELAARVVRFIDSGSSLQQDRVIIDNLPCASNHCGGRIAFGPDGYLYVSVGDARQPRLAQDSSVLNGKILRITDVGQTPPGNPFGDLFTYSIGHRNVQGLTWHPETDVFFVTEHGPSGIDGVGGGDEINVIKPGENYGWPIVSHEKADSRFISPKLVFTPAVAPAAGMFYKSGKISEFKNNFFFALLKGEGIMKVVISKEDPEKIESFAKLSDINFGRIREITEGPDGAIYFSTSNRDGRGNVRPNDDKIYRMVPK